MARPRVSLALSLAAVGLVASALTAQTPKIRRSVSLDLAGLARGEIRAALDPVVVGRVALGVSLGRWWGGGSVYYPVALGTDLAAPSPYPTLHPAREYMVDLSARVYPLSFASADPKHPITGYVGALVGFHRREFEQAIYYPPCLDVCPLTEPPIPCCGPPQYQQTRTVTNGIEPGMEFGVRATPWHDLFVEVGGWARLITFSDPTGRFEEGQVASRFTLAVGYGW